MHIDLIRLKLRLIAVVVFSSVPFLGLGQDTTAVIHLVSSNTQEVFSSELIEKEYEMEGNTPSIAHAKIKEILLTLHLAGYVEAGVDSIVRSENQLYVAYLTIGEIYRWSHLDVSAISNEYRNRAGLKEKFYSQKTFNGQRIRLSLEKVVRQFENSGFPFAQAHLDSVDIEEGLVSAKVDVVRGPFIRIDSIRILGKPGVSKQYIANYIGIKEGDPYDESQIEKISTRIKEIPFLEEIQAAEVEFTDVKTQLFLYIRPKKANDFNGVIGFLPDATTGDLVVTGDVSLKLRNSLNYGEEMFVNWRRLADRTQDLVAQATLPFLFGTPIGIEGYTKIYRRDTLFNTVNLRAGLQYALTGGNYIEAFVERETSNIISVKAYENATTLPEVADISNFSYGLKVRFSDLDYRLNPTRGYILQGKFGIGNKTIAENPALDSIIYEGVELKTTQYSVEAAPELYIPVGGRFTVKNRFQFGTLVNEKLFRNEAYRIGGLITLRGFNEESIFATSYAIYTIEPRFILEENSYLFTFFDGAFYEDKSAATYRRDNPYGFGAGVSFQTKPGIFSISYALGSEMGNPILLGTGKIHFGFVNLF